MNVSLNSILPSFLSFVQKQIISLVSLKVSISIFRRGLREDGV